MSHSDPMRLHWVSLPIIVISDITWFVVKRKSKGIECHESFQNKHHMEEWAGRPRTIHSSLQGYDAQVSGVMHH